MGYQSRTSSKYPRSRKNRADEPTRAERNVAWIEKYARVPEGRFVGKPLKLAAYMREDLKAIYDNPHGTRRAIISRGRKNAKTVEAALILLLHLCGPEAKPNSQLNSAAQSRDQAAILFSLAAKIVRMNPVLSDVVQIRDTAKQLLCPALGTAYRALSAEATTAYGLSPALTVHDELGQCRGPRSELYEALETATAAQDEPLTVIISTQAPTDADLLSILIDDAAAGHDERTILRIDTADMSLDPFGEEAIRQANPAFDHFMNRAEVLGMAADAQRMPSRQAEFENLILNRRVEATAPFISRQLWQSCDAAPLPIEAHAVYGGLDLSSAQDLTALVLGARVDGVWQIHPAFWLPATGLAAKARVDRVPYDVWHQDGHLLTAPGKSVDYEYVAEYLRGVFDRYDVRKIAFDRWGWRHLRPWLLKAGFSEPQLDEHFVEYGQGFQDMSPALRALEAEILNGRIAHGGHPVLSMNMANAVVKSDPAGNRKLAKDRSAGRIDGAVALAMLCGVAPLEDSPEIDIRAMIV